LASERTTGLRGGCTPTVICLGETMVMFAPPPNELIEYSLQFTSLLGGSEANVAIGLERLGVHAGWIGKLPDSALGRKLVNETRSFGVDTSAVVWSETGRVGTFFVEWGVRPRRISTIYDRANSAATTLTADELDWDYIRGAKWLHLTGISPALSETCRVSTCEIAVRARSYGVRVSFDANYRSLLWSEERARATWAEILPAADLLIATEADAAIILGERVPRESALRALFARFDLAAAVLTLGDEGSLAFDGNAFHRSTGYEIQPVNRLGAGDAFAAGLLYGYLGSGLQSGLDYGSAMAALKMTVPQNIPLATREEVERLLTSRNLEMLR
jgi:2-dehydro-3-deoxygluconokinase